MKVKGIIPALLTPLTVQQKVNEPVLRQLANSLIDAGVHGLFALGTNGEFHLLTEEEKLKIAEVLVEEVNGRVPVIVGTGGNSTEEVISLSNKMERLGVDALSIITPYFVTPTQEEVIVHFQKIASSTSLPILLYNIPSKTGMSLDPQTVATLAKVDNIIGIKDSSGNFENIKHYIYETKEKDFSVLAGTDSLILKTLQEGGVGAIAATANMIPEIVVDIYNNWSQGNGDKAEEAQQKLQPLRDTFQYGTLPAALKKAVELSGLPVGPPKFPVQPISGMELAHIQKMVEGYKKQSVSE
ncbi:4-hydroxy-tetrahydrodipicolinate synthase [Priestia endophytica]|uniref:4-hydroxy-tetrahydrodipicolinate synthase n=1 Tax=Priestia endophytica TaxID=135735 RepID=UPI00204028B0|nr:4-hydroxy-tetrahydrodipicolinate synthase [Priestia endophytica]MCM3538362.1 4-hydroxy-tetrahydrodipicolinate synthase [Priestia endophytica]